MKGCKYETGPATFTASDPHYAETPYGSDKPFLADSSILRCPVCVSKQKIRGAMLSSGSCQKQN
jgi:hypothetical protein